LMVFKGTQGAQIKQFVTVANQPAAARTSAVVSWDDRALTVVFDCVETCIH